MEILYQDNRILICAKPFGVLSTDEPGGLPELLRQELGDPRACVRTVHRLDRVAGGLMVLARSRGAASRLSRQMREGAFEKTYLALCHGEITPPAGAFRDLLLRDKEQRRTLVVPEPGKDVQEARLEYRTLAVRQGLSLVEIRLLTGRTHQIRAQFSHRGHPLAGDYKYGAPAAGEGAIALWSHSLRFHHPQTGKEVSFTVPPPGEGLWELFAGGVL